MAKELNPPELLAKRGEESRKRMEKGDLPESPIDPERVAQVEALLKDPVKYLKKSYINQQYQPRDTELVKLLLLAKILEKLHGP